MSRTPLDKKLPKRADYVKVLRRDSLPSKLWENNWFTNSLTWTLAYKTALSTRPVNSTVFYLPVQSPEPLEKGDETEHEKYVEDVRIHREKETLVNRVSFQFLFMAGRRKSSLKTFNKSKLDTTRSDTTRKLLFPLPAVSSQIVSSSLFTNLSIRNLLPSSRYCKSNRTYPYLYGSSLYKIFSHENKNVLFSAETKYFVCACPRCVDPTELGTLFSSIKSVDNI